MLSDLNQDLLNFIRTIYPIHLNNSEYIYYARKRASGSIPLVPINTFIYEFFLFNSLYSINWEESTKNKQLSYYERTNQDKQQKGYLEYLRTIVEKDMSLLHRAFKPLTILYGLFDTDGRWNQVTEDSRVTSKDGEEFFKNIKYFTVELRKQFEKEEDIDLDLFFRRLKECVKFIYKVRNNIFHGSKSLGVYSDSFQNNRLIVYSYIIIGLNSLLFLGNKEQKAGCDNISYLNERYFKISDKVPKWRRFDNKEIIDRFKNSKQISLNSFSPEIPSDNSALFYPSAGKDYITPLLLALPTCTHFYYYDLSLGNDNEILSQLAWFFKRIQIKDISLVKENEDRYLEFQFDGTIRRLHFIKADNCCFLDKDVELRFYFHRGDSWGEGGSGQEWDSKLLPKLLEKIPNNSKCYFFTDGHPGGLNTENLHHYDVQKKEMTLDRNTFNYGWFRRRKN